MVKRKQDTWPVDFNCVRPQLRYFNRTFIKQNGILLYTVQSALILNEKCLFEVLHRNLQLQRRTGKLGFFSVFLRH